MRRPEQCASQIANDKWKQLKSEKIPRSRWSGDINGGIAACLFVLLFLIFRSCLLYSSLCKAQIAAPEVHRQQFIGAKNESWLCWLLVSKPFHLAAAAIVAIRFTFTFTEYITIKSKEKSPDVGHGQGIEYTNTHIRTMAWTRARKRFFCADFSSVDHFIVSRLLFTSLSLRFPLFVIRFFSPLPDTTSTEHGTGLVCCVRYNGGNWIAANILIRYCRVHVCSANWWNSSKWIKCEWCCVCHTKLFCVSVDVRLVCVRVFVRSFCVNSHSIFVSFSPSYQVLTHSQMINDIVCVRHRAAIRCLLVSPVRAPFNCCQCVCVCVRHVDSINEVSHETKAKNILILCRSHSHTTIMIFRDWHIWYAVDVESFTVLIFIKRKIPIKSFDIRTRKSQWWFSVCAVLD